MKKIFFLVNKYEKQICYIENKSIFFDVMKNYQVFSSRFYNFQYFTDSFSVERRGKLERGRRYVCKNLLSLDFQDSIRFGIFQAAYK